MKVYLACDHGGFELKEKLKEYLTQELKSINDQRIEVIDLGPSQINPADDYPDYIFPLAEKVAGAAIENAHLTSDKSVSQFSIFNSQLVLGVAACRSGGGEVIAANKVRGARAVLSWRADHAAKCRSDDNANIICLPADYINEATAKEIVKTFLTTKFSQAERHVRRLKKIEEYEGKN